MWGGGGHTPPVNVTTASSNGAGMFRNGCEVFFSDDVTAATMQSLVKALKEAEEEALDAVDAVTKSLKLEKNEKKLVDVAVKPRPIVLHLSTNGGSVYAALATVDVIQALKVPVHTVVSGFVASAGTLLSIAGAKRFVTPHSFMLVHELRSGFWGKYTEAREQCENLDQLMELIIKFYSSKSKIAVADMKDILSRDRIWGADECLEKGLVDEVLKP